MMPTHKQIKRALETIGTVAVVATVVFVVAACAEWTPTPANLREIEAWWREALDIGRR